MLTISIAVPHGDDVEQAAYQRLLHEAHLRRLHLARPLAPTITHNDHGIHTLAGLLGLPTGDYTYYKIQCETVPCPPT
ncbi:MULTISPECIES: hypothetical protein [unclassified Streptomyces]|uniref:hypothetical protein n=1 Tax=unclassified Streptomyces TaxID=2593676 RepID=UPI0033EEE7A4